MAMSIEIWTDIVCPWCGIGHHRLLTALGQFPHRDQITLIHRSFQLDPTLSLEVATPVREHLERVKGLPSAQLDQMTRQVETIALADGLRPYHVGDNLMGNTALAHEFAAWATVEGAGDQVWSRLFRAHFGERHSIFTVASLVDLAPSIGLSAEGARAALTTRRYAAQVQEDQELAQQFGIRGVPFVAIDRRLGVSGAQPVTTLLEAIQQGWDSREAAPS